MSIARPLREPSLQITTVSVAVCAAANKGEYPNRAGWLITLHSYIYVIYCINYINGLGQCTEMIYMVGDPK